MADQVVPEIVTSDVEIAQIAGLSLHNSFAFASGNGEFGIATLGSDGSVKTRALKKGFPDDQMDAVYADGSGTLIWGTRGRGLYVLDVAAGKTDFKVVSNDGDHLPLHAWLTAPDKKTILVDIGAYGWTPAEMKYYCRIYDVGTGALSERTAAMEGLKIPFGPQQLLWCDMEAPGKVSWLNADLSFTRKWDTKLTDKLTKSQLVVSNMAPAWNIARRIMIGHTFAGDFFSVLWDEAISDVKVEPLALQCPNEYAFDGTWHISEDGTWAAAHGYETTTARSYRFLYHVDRAYPQSLSLPVRGMEITDNVYGVFVQHDAWGPLYVEPDRRQRRALYVYRLNQVIENLKSRLK